MANKVNHVILEAVTEQEIMDCFPVVNLLRPHITTPAELLESTLIQKAEGFHLVYIKDTIENDSEPRVVSILGYKISHCYFYGKQLYIADLATLTTAKKKGYGGALLDWAIAKGKEEKCSVVSLDSGYTRTDAHRLYMNKKFVTKCHHFCHDIDYTN